MGGYGDENRNADVFLSKSDKLVVASIEEKDPVHVLNIDERQILKDFEDRLVDSMLILDTTADTIASLSRNYQSYCRACKTLSHDVTMEDPDTVLLTLQEQGREVESSKRNIETLHRKVQGSIQLVRMCSD